MPDEIRRNYSECTGYSVQTCDNNVAHDNDVVKLDSMRWTAMDNKQDQKKENEEGDRNGK